eukprot:gene497-270_t
MSTVTVIFQTERHTQVQRIASTTKVVKDGCCYYCCCCVRCSPSIPLSLSQFHPSATALQRKRETKSVATTNSVVVRKICRDNFLFVSMLSSCMSIWFSTILRSSSAMTRPDGAGDEKQLLFIIIIIIIIIIIYVIRCMIILFYIPYRSSFILSIYTHCQVDEKDHY